jgi:large subunit ribosomal protein L4
LWRGGGVVFAAQPKSYAQKVNRKMYRGAMRSILSELARQGRLVVLPELSLSAPKTKELNQRLRDLELSDVLILVDGFDDPVFLAGRNLPNVDVMAAQEADPVSLIAFEEVLATEAAVRKLEGRLA